MPPPIIFVILLAGMVIAPARQASRPASLPVEEIFTQQTGLKITLRLPAAALRLGQDPQLSVRFLNEGSSVLYLNPHVEPGLYVPRADGTPVTPPVSGIADRFAPPRVRRADLIALEPGRSWSVPISPTRFERDRYTAYAEHGFTKEAGWALLLTPGRYTARFVYINAPDYWASYDPYEMPRSLWEGRLEADPVPFTVVAPSADQLAADVRRLTEGARGSRPSLLPLLALSATQLVEQFIATPDSRPQLLQAARLHAEPLLPRLLTALESLPPSDQDMMLYSTEFTALLREQADCGVVRILLGRLQSTRGDVLHALRPIFEKTAPQCPEVRDRLRAIVADASALPDARGNAAALLGTFRNAADVPPLIDALDRPFESISDPRARGAAVGLTMIGGRAASQALTRLFADDRRNAAIGSVVVPRLATMGADAAEPLLAALSSSHATLVVAALAISPTVTSDAIAPRLLELLRHPNATIRTYAARAIRLRGEPNAVTAMRAAADDPDQNVQQDALFYLAERGDGADVELLASRLDSTHQYVREAARAGIARWGTAATFPRVHSLLASPNASVKAESEMTLSALTFVQSRPHAPAPRWDEWYAGHRDASRVDWAREAMAGLRDASLDDRRFQLSAIRYLADHGAARFRADFESAAASRRPFVRIEAARALAGVDRRRAAELLVREFDGRLVGACELANRTLNELAGQSRSVECTDPAARRRARDAWAAANYFR